MSLSLQVKRSTASLSHGRDGNNDGIKGSLDCDLCLEHVRNLVTRSVTAVVIPGHHRDICARALTLGVSEGAPDESSRKSPISSLVE